MFCVALYAGKKEKKVEPWLDVIRHSPRTNARYYCAVSRTLISQFHRGRLAALESCGVRGNGLEAPVLFRARELLGTREEEESCSDDQKQEDIDGLGEVEHRLSKKRSRQWYIVVTDQTE